MTPNRPTLTVAPRRATPVAAGRAAATRTRILAAAEELVLRDGVAHLTIEATAAEAELSKGGVLYHFPTRAALVAGMVAVIIDEFDADIAARLAADPEVPGAYARAYVGATFAPASGEGAGEREDRLGAAVLAAAAAEPGLLVPLQVAATRWQTQLDADGIDPSVAVAVRLACDGLWLCDLFGLATPTDARRRALADHLLAVIGGAP